MVTEKLPLVSEIAARFLEGTVKILDAVRAGSFDLSGLPGLSGSFQQLGLVILIMGCAALGTIGLLKIIKRFLGDRGDKW